VGGSLLAGSVLAGSALAVAGSLPAPRVQPALLLRLTTCSPPWCAAGWVAQWVAGLQQPACLGLACVAALLNLGLAAFNATMLVGVDCSQDATCRGMSAYVGLFSAFLLLHAWLGVSVCWQAGRLHLPAQRQPSCDPAWQPHAYYQPEDVSGSRDR